MSEALEERHQLPEPLRVLLRDYPREAWDSHDNFSALMKFWLERHLMFRRLLGAMQRETEAVMKKDMAATQFAAHLSRYGSLFLNDLHMHHSIEDTVYFPKLKLLDRRISHGFEILDLDHHRIDGHLQKFASDADGALRAIRENGDAVDKLGAFHGRLNQLAMFLNRHLSDEEELVVPVLLAHTPDGLA